MYMISVSSNFSKLFVPTHFRYSFPKTLFKLSEMESTFFGDVKFEKEKALARFNRFQKLIKFWQILEIVIVFGLISWSAVHIPEILRISGSYFVEISSYLMNHHVIFLIGNLIIVLLFLLCKQNQSDFDFPSGEDLYSDYIKHSVAVVAEEPEIDLVQESVEEEKQIVVVDDVAVAIEEAKMVIEKFQRSESDILKREFHGSEIVRWNEELTVTEPDEKKGSKKQIKKFKRTQSDNPLNVKCRPELRRSETEKSRREIETLSDEEFQRRCEAYITGSKRRNMIR